MNDELYNYLDWYYSNLSRAIEIINSVEIEEMKEGELNVCESN